MNISLFFADEVILKVLSTFTMSKFYSKVLASFKWENHSEEIRFFKYFSLLLVSFSSQHNYNLAKTV